MGKIKKLMFGICIIALLLILPNVTATGTCSLDDYLYAPGQTASFTCTCDTPQERFADGFMVWRQSNGTILQNTSDNSGSCNTGPFGDSYVFLSGQDFIGNVTWETTAVEWADADDVINDSFNVTGAGDTACILTFVGGTPNSELTLGRSAYSYITITDGITGRPLRGAACVAKAIRSSDDVPISKTPQQNEGIDSIKSDSEGHVVIEHQMSEYGWVLGQSYTGEYHCSCSNDSTTAQQDDYCYAGDNGEFIRNYKTCSLQYILTPQGGDLRTVDNQAVGGVSISITLFILFVAFFIIALPFIVQVIGLPFSIHPRVHLILKRCFMIVGVYILVFFSTIMMTLVNAAGLDSLINPMLFFVRLFGWAGYVMLVFLMFKTLLDVIAMGQEEENERRFGT